MSRSIHLLFAASLALAPLPALAATPGALQADQSPSMPAPGGDHAKGGKLAALLTPEQRAMFVADSRAQLKDMAPDQRKAWRKDQIAKFVALSPSERQKFQSDLQTRWDALPAGQKARIQQRLASREGTAQ